MAVKRDLDATREDYVGMKRGKETDFGKNGGSSGDGFGRGNR